MTRAKILDLKPSNVCSIGRDAAQSASIRRCRIGISRRTLYRIYRSKSELLGPICEAGFDPCRRIRTSHRRAIFPTSLGWRDDDFEAGGQGLRLP